MSNQTCPTVQIITPAGVVTINESDYNEAEHTLDCVDETEDPIIATFTVPVEAPAPWAAVK